MYSGFDLGEYRSLNLQALRLLPKQERAWGLVKVLEMAQVAWALALAGVWAAVQVRAVAQALVGAAAEPVPPCAFPSPQAPQWVWAFAAAQAGPAAPRHGRPVPRR